MSYIKDSNDQSSKYSNWKDFSVFHKSLSIVLALILIVCIALIIYFAHIDRGETFTEFYILGPDGKADDYPRVVNLEDDIEVIAGIVNHEYKNVTYWIDISLNGSINSEIGPLALDHSEKWEQMVAVTTETTGQGQNIELILYKDNKDEQYLILNLQVDVKEP